MSDNTFYVTTPIYYPSGKMTIGNAYTSIIADVLARYNRNLGKDVFFLSGQDEHGLKIEQVAEKMKISPQQYVDQMAEQNEKLWKLLDISYDRYIRTTDADHQKAVQLIFEKLLAQGDIYLGEYTGWYSVSDEEYFTESQLAEVYRDEAGNVTGGKAPSGHEVQLIKEPSYFFKMSKYADRLLKYYEDHPEFIEPNSREKEMVNNFIKPGLEDLSVSRTSVDWGIKVPSDPKHVVYVWIDALSNYITALGYGSDDTTLFDKFWPADIQLVGKEIVRFHTIYWPIMLMALGLPLPKKVFGHGWLVMKDGKMSKSKGNAVYPEMIVGRYGLDALRYYLVQALPYGNDGIFSPEDFVERVNFDLANDLGNLLNRTVSMINKYFGGKVEPVNGVVTEFDQSLKDAADAAISGFDKQMNALQFSRALEEAFGFVRRANKYIDETSPWVLAKDDSKKNELQAVMNNLAESLRVIALLISPVLTEAPKKIFEQLGLDFDDNNMRKREFGANSEEFTVVEKPTPIFPRLDVAAEVEFIKGEMAKSKPKKLSRSEKKDEQGNKDNSKELKFEDFEKVEMRVGQVVNVERVEGSDKLLKFELDFNEEKHRQILSGISKFYPGIDTLVGKKIIAVTNLKPRKIFGQMSEGMLLSSEKDDKVNLVFVDDAHELGALLG